MKLLASIPELNDESKRFEGIYIPVDGVYGIVPGDFRVLAKRIVEESGVKDGTIPVMVSDTENNFTAMTFEVKDGEWQGSVIDGWTGHDGHWTSCREMNDHGSVRGEIGG